MKHAGANTLAVLLAMAGVAPMATAAMQSQSEGNALHLSPIDDPVVLCATQRLKPFVSPYGIQQAWPVADALPVGYEHALGTLLSDTGIIADGYQQFLHVDAEARAVYVVEQGGFAGTRKVFGPLPLPRCTSDPQSGASPPR